jgi:hypothetical protein
MPAPPPAVPGSHTWKSASTFPYRAGWRRK